MEGGIKTEFEEMVSQTQHLPYIPISIMWNLLKNTLLTTLKFKMEVLFCFFFHSWVIHEVNLYFNDLTDPECLKYHEDMPCNLLGPGSSVSMDKQIKRKLCQLPRSCMNEICVYEKLVRRINYFKMDLMQRYRLNDYSHFQFYKMGATLIHEFF